MAPDLRTIPPAPLGAAWTRGRAPDHGSSHAAPMELVENGGAGCGYTHAAPDGAEPAITDGPGRTLLSSLGRGLFTAPLSLPGNSLPVIAGGAKLPA